MKIIMSQNNESIVSCKDFKKIYIQLHHDNTYHDEYQIFVDFELDEKMIASYLTKERAIAVLKFVATFLCDDCSSKNLLKMPNEELAQELVEKIKN